MRQNFLVNVLVVLLLRQLVKMRELLGYEFVRKLAVFFGGVKFAHVFVVNAFKAAYHVVRPERVFLVEVVGYFHERVRCSRHCGKHDKLLLIG